MHDQIEDQIPAQSPFDDASTLLRGINSALARLDPNTRIGQPEIQSTIEKIRSLIDAQFEEIGPYGNRAVQFLEEFGHDGAPYLVIQALTQSLTDRWTRNDGFR